MCGIIGIVDNNSVNQSLFDGLTVLQHRGQDSAGIATCHKNNLFQKKAKGLVNDIFDTKDMLELQGNLGIGHVRYPTAGSHSIDEAQPFYVNSPYGIALAHNGNLDNSELLRDELLVNDRRHIHTQSDTEVLLNIFANELLNVESSSFKVPDLFNAINGVHKRCSGAYAVVALIAGYGLVAFRDIHGIRPLILGRKKNSSGYSYIVSSESVALDLLGYETVRDLEPGESIFIDIKGKMHNSIYAQNLDLNPCIFEYVYFSRPDSIIDGINVQEARMRMGKQLANKILREWADNDIDVIIPIPDTSRTAALEMAIRLNKNYREGLIKNRYIGRTFIMQGQAVRKKSVRYKLNPLVSEFKNKNVLLVDDSIVRGTTSKEIVQMARDSGAKKVYFASASPPIRFPNIYGIDMPSKNDLIANGRETEEICKEIGADKLIYQDIDDLVYAVQAGNTDIKKFETSVFTGEYLTNVNDKYFQDLEKKRHST
ncbi:MAG: amidophosphoribosyltransferase [Gammaproteobacteria bacterium]|jgi:amidophosphoribosyltransferase|nr:amidophosphoribosyltransferase [Gammaproteobacteria bacterium]MBT7603224.1 amidophosphoribosyltransferase [Gammaproteobacteria bacterium]